MTELPLQAFMGHIPVNDENFDYLETIIKTYSIGQYIIAAETTPYDHFHFIVYMSNDDYHKFSKRVFKDKYKLKGRASKGNPRQYGKCKDIRDPTKMMAYTVKDGNFRTDMSKQQIEALVKLSFEKAETKDLLQECIDYVDAEYFEYDEIQLYNDKVYVALPIIIIGFLRSKKLTVTPASVKRYYYHVSAYSKKLETTDERLFRILFSMGI